MLSEYVPLSSQFCQNPLNLYFSSHCIALHFHVRIEWELNQRNQSMSDRLMPQRCQLNLKLFSSRYNQ